MDGGADLLGRIEKLERDTRLLKRACALLLALLAAGVLVMQLILASHVKATEDPHPNPAVNAVPSRR